MKKAKIFENICIILFVIIITSFASIQIYRAVVNSDWYNEAESKKSFEKMIERINQVENIDHIEIDNEVTKDAPAELFDDISLEEYKMVDTADAAQMHLHDKWVVIVYKDNTYDVLSITEDNEIYWGYFIKVKCPSLTHWLASNPTTE